MLIVRGNNVFPSSIEAIIREIPEIVEFRIVVSRQREMNHVKLEIEPHADVTASAATALGDRLAKTIKERLQFQTEIELASSRRVTTFRNESQSASLGNDGSRQGDSVFHIGVPRSWSLRQGRGMEVCLFKAARPCRSSKTVAPDFCTLKNRTALSFRWWRVANGADR